MITVGTVNKAHGSIIDDSRVTHQLVASLIIIIYDRNIIMVQAMRSVFGNELPLALGERKLWKIEITVEWIINMIMIIIEDRDWLVL